MTSAPRPSSAAKKVANEFAATRAKAIDAYAGVEASMAWLFSHLMGANDERKSYFVFSRLISPRSKRQALEELLEIVHPKAYDDFFSSVMKLVQGLDGPRNKIVHWTTIRSSTGGKPFDPETDVFLRDHPNIYGGEKMMKSELVAFEKQADFLRLVIYYFTLYLKQISHLSHDPEWKPWREIFQKRCIYPPPPDHPALGPSHKEP